MSRYAFDATLAVAALEMVLALVACSSSRERPDYFCCVTTTCNQPVLSL